MADSWVPGHTPPHASFTRANVRDHKAPACLYPILYGAPSPGWGLGTTRPVFLLSPGKWRGRGGQSRGFCTFVLVAGLNGRPERPKTSRPQFPDLTRTMSGVTELSVAKIGHTATNRTGTPYQYGLPLQPQPLLP